MGCQLLSTGNSSSRAAKDLQDSILNIFWIAKRCAPVERISGSRLDDVWAHCCNWWPFVQEIHSRGDICAMEMMRALRKWDGVRSYVRLFRRRPIFSGLVLFLTILGMLTDSLGLITLIPLLDVLTGSGASSALSVKILSWWEALGVRPELTGLLLAFVVLMAFRGSIRIAKGLASTRLRAELTDDLRNEAIAVLMRAEWRWLGDQKRSDQTNMLLTEVQRAGTGVFAALSLLATAAAILAYLLTAMTIEPLTTALAAFGGGLMLMLFGGLRRRAMRLGQEQLIANRRLFENTLESIGAIKLAKILGTTELHLTSFGQAVTDLRENQIQFVLFSSVSRELFQLFGAIIVASYVYVSVIFWDKPLPELFVMVFVFARLVPMLTSVQKFLQMMMNALPALLEAETIIAQARDAAEPAQDTEKAAISLSKDLRLSNVSIRYTEGDTLALSDVTLRLPAGSTTVIMGPSGAGKSTLADVFMGLLRPDEGKIVIDSVALTDPDRVRWRRSVSYVPQEITRYSGTIRENLERGKPAATDADIDAALAAASADFVYALPNGIDTLIGDGAHGLSGGEKQRLALARGLLRSPSLLVLDEVTSSLDPENELKIRDSLANLAGKMTIVILGHRNAFLQIADQVLRLEDGKLVTEVRAA
jgi:ATP-binding cassette, subfamily C, bacterial